MLSKIARRQWLAVCLAGIAPLVIRALLMPWMPVPNPRVQDEFSHLLVADTFADGRVVNPPHAMRVHFESMHIIVEPVYASVYPVAPGLMMAAGKTVFAHPWAGVWMSVGLMCAALCWMLQGWVSPEWALTGALLAAARWGVFSYWMNSYYGGALAAAGGALVLGALPRAIRWGGWQYGAIMGLGLAILANSRPYEGMLLGGPVAAVLLWKLHWRPHRGAVLAGLIVVISVAAAGTGWYFFRVTGSPAMLPYSFYRSHFTEAPHFIFQQPRAKPVYHHRVLHDFHANWEMACYNDARHNRPPHGVRDKGIGYLRFYFGPWLAVAGIAALWSWRKPRVRFLLFLLALMAVGLSIQVWDANHYAAPAMGLVLLIATEGVRRLQNVAPRWIFLALVAGCALTPVVGGGDKTADGSLRAGVLKQLETAGGKHLVVVRYTRNHDVGNEWVYNAANIDLAAVVWAREMDPTSNRALVDYFAGRQLWIVEPDKRPIELRPYDPAIAPIPPFRFVKFGTPEIQVLASPERMKADIQSRAPASHLSCDQWNYWFTAVTGVEAPDPSNGCFPPGQRKGPVAFQDWFAWIEKQR